ncbi:DUF4235 domain-containing protein [Wenjunlia tyrosinilytica]|uniref:Membrane protein n=1 Tax=Wenjunlia tyrosinilytica TaxID=1544741 RepID=A0A918DSQ3_9ACTN|nr:DUF4235 domain-containing protein [Wenjunlia tyrosinilytica]GGO81956.1 membrane protein [Wenjunlia tyrosinilytica]
MKAVKVLYKPVGMTLGAVGGLVAGALFKRVWKAAGHEDDAPDATDEDRGWPQIMLAAALEGLIFSVVRAAVERGGAVATRRVTGTWPG